MRLKEVNEKPNSFTNSSLYPKKMILKHGVKHFLLDTRDIVYCYSYNKVVYIVDTADQKYVADKNLMRLELELDPQFFFKANRNQIINANFIHSFVTHEKNKVKVELKAAPKLHTVIVSQPRVNDFRQWIYKQL